VLGIYLAESGTGYVATAVLVGIAAVLTGMDRWHPPSFTRSRRRRWAMRSLAVVLFVGVIAGIDVAGRMLDRDLTSVSGRVPLWHAIWTQTTGLDRWFGAGWGVVWPHPWHPAAPNEAYDEIVLRAGAALAHGHNSVFDLIPELGLLGVALMATVYAQAFAHALALRSPTKGALPPQLEASRSALLGIVGLIIFGLAEPMSTIPLGWFAITLLATGLIPTDIRVSEREPVAGFPDPERADASLAETKHLARGCDLP
jgi:O-antigen ligase